jgi:hypothetical protein
MRRAWAVAFVLASASSAVADDATEPATSEAPHVTEPILTNIPVMSSGLVIDARLDYTDYRDTYDPNMISLLPVVQYTTPTGFGGYLALPAPMVEYYDPGNGATQKQLGATSLGGLYAYRGPLDVTARLGFGIPAFGDRTVPYLAAVTRPLDFAQQSGEAKWLHTQVAAQYSHRFFSVGATAVLDVPLFAQSDYDGYVSASKSASLAATAGLHNDRLGVSIGVALYEPIDDYDYDRFVTLNGLVDIAAMNGARVFLSYGHTDFGDGGQSLGAGVRIWR